jgi:hypothetical protein
MVRSLHDPVNAFEGQGVGRLTTRVAAAALRERPGAEIRASTGVGTSAAKALLLWVGRGTAEENPDENYRPAGKQTSDAWEW